jgi:hypothetical protein
MMTVSFRILDIALDVSTPPPTTYRVPLINLAVKAPRALGISSPSVNHFIKFADIRQANIILGGVSHYLLWNVI